MIENIIFDYGGVFTRGSRADFVVRSLGTSRDKRSVLRAFFDSDFIRQAAEGKWSTDQVVRRLQRHVGHADITQIRDVLTQACKPNTRLLKILYQLKERYSVFIISDSLPPYSEYLVREFDCLLDGLFLSDQMGARKSGPLFTLVETVSPGLFVNSVYIDDREKNLISAERLGSVGLLFKSTEDLIEDLNKLGVDAKT